MAAKLGIATLAPSSLHYLLLLYGMADEAREQLFALKDRVQKAVAQAGATVQATVPARAHCPRCPRPFSRHLPFFHMKGPFCERCGHFRDADQGEI